MELIMDAEKVIVETRPARTDQPYGDAMCTYRHESPVAFASEKPDGDIDVFVAGWIRDGLVGPYLWKTLTMPVVDNGKITEAALMKLVNLRDGAAVFDITRDGKPVEVRVSYEPAAPPTNNATEPDYRCPGCNTMSDFVIGETQALCRNMNCRVIHFDPSLPDGGLSQAGVIEIPDLWEPSHP